MSQNTVQLVLGRKGQGKSYSIKRWLDKLPRHAPVLVFDRNLEYAGPHAKDGIRDAVAFRTLDEFLAAQKAQPGHIGRAVVGGTTRDFERVCRYAHAAGGLTLVLDELHVYVNERTPPPEIFAELLYVGRHRRVNVVCGAWRPIGLPLFLRHAVDEIRVFQCTEPRDLAWFREVCGENFASKLPSLPPHVSASWHANAAAPSAAPSTRKRGSK